MLQYDNLPRDLHGQTAVYDQAAADYAAGRQWRPFYYAETGIGNYRENSSSSTDLFGGAGDYDTFLPIRVGGGWNKSLTERHSFNGTLDYRFRSVRRQQPAQRFGPALELQRQSPGGRRQPALRHARPGQLSRRRPVP